MKINIQELRAAASFLHQAHLLVGNVASLFYYAGESDTAARLRAIDDRIADEISAVDRLIDAER
jgi:hypothetical protein